MPTERVLVELLLHRGVQAVEGLPQIHRAQRDKHPRSRRKANHNKPTNCSTKDGGTCALKRTVSPRGLTTSAAQAGPSKEPSGTFWKSPLLALANRSDRRSHWRSR